MDDLPIIELPEHYRIDGESLGIAHVSAQANTIAENQVQLQKRQSDHEIEQQRFIEQHVEAAREEAEARSSALILAIQQAYGDPSTLELRVDARIQNVLQHLQHGAQEQARAVAEAQFAEQAALNKLVEQRMHTALQHIEQEVNMRTDQRIQELRQGIYSFVEDQSRVAIHRAGDDARAFVQRELNDRCGAYQDSIARSEARVVELVRGIIDKHERSTRIRHEQEIEALIDRVEERLREVVVVAKKAAETKIYEMLEPKIREMLESKIREMLEPKIREVVALQLNPKNRNTAALDPKFRKAVELQMEPTCSNIAPVALSERTAAAPTKSRLKSQHRTKTRAQVEKDRQDEARHVERKAKAKLDRIRQEAQAALSARATTRAAELLHPNPKARTRH